MYIVYSHQTGSPFVSCWNSIISKGETTGFPTKQVLLRILNHAMAFPALSHGASPWVQMLKSSWSICPFQGWNSMEFRSKDGNYLIIWIWFIWFIIWFSWFQSKDGFPQWIIMMESTSVIMIHSYYGSWSQLGSITDSGKITKLPSTTFPSRWPRLIELQGSADALVFQSNHCGMGDLQQFMRNTPNLHMFVYVCKTYIIIYPR